MSELVAFCNAPYCVDALISRQARSKASRSEWPRSGAGVFFVDDMYACLLPNCLAPKRCERTFMALLNVESRRVNRHLQTTIGRFAMLDSNGNRIVEVGHGFVDGQDSYC